MIFAVQSFLHWITSVLVYGHHFEWDENNQIYEHQTSVGVVECLWEVCVWVRAGGAVFLICCLAPSWWHLNDARLVDDTSAAVALLHDSNNPGSTRRTQASCCRVLALHLCTELGCLLPGQADQQATWRVGQEEGCKAVTIYVLKRQSCCSYLKFLPMCPEPDWTGFHRLCWWHSSWL